MAERRRTPAARDRGVEQERRERLRRERERQRAQAAPARRRAASPPAPVAVATRERHEGLVGWVVRMVASVPTLVLATPRGVARVLRGFGLEVLAVVAGIARSVLAFVPGGRRLAGGGARRAQVGAGAGPSTSTVDDEFDWVVDVQDVPAARQAGPSRQRAERERRERLRARLRLAGVVGLLAALVVGWITIPASDAFRIRHLEVTGASAVGDLEVRERIDPLLEGRTVFTVDEDELASRVRELPFVRDVRVERHLPGGLQLHVSEYRPLALGYGDAKFWLVAHDGRILARARPQQWKGTIPTVTLRGDDLRPGDRVGDEPALRLLAAQSADSPLEFDTIEVSRYSLTATLKDDVDGTVEVRFGRPNQFRQKLLAAELMMRIAARRDQELLYVDVTVPGYAAMCTADVGACSEPRGEDEAAAQVPADDAGAAPA